VEARLQVGQHSHQSKPKRWIVGQYFGAFNRSRRDRWVFGDRDSGAYLAKFAWTKIVRHILVKGRSSPDDPALVQYWADRRRKGPPLPTLLVTGTMVMTPRPCRAALALALSLLTITAGRRWLASLPRTGSRSVRRISPRSMKESVGCGDIPRRSVPRGFPLVPGCRIRLFEFRVALQPDRVLNRCGPRCQACRLGVLVQRGDLILREANTQLHTSMLLRSYHVGYRGRIKYTGNSSTRNMSAVLDAVVGLAPALQPLHRVEQAQRVAR